MLHREHYGIGQTEPLRLARFEPERGLHGTGLLAFDWLYDGAGNSVDFHVATPSLLVTGGRILIRQRDVPVSAHPNGYAIYANVRLQLVGPYAVKADMPALDWSTPGGTQIMMHGNNIRDVVHHYAHLDLSHQRLLQPGYYRLEVWLGAGTDAIDVDGLGELPDYNGDNIHQFWVRIEGQT